MTRSSTHIIHLGDQTLTYTLHRRRGQKHKYIRIKDGEVIVSAPYLTPINSINSFLFQKSDWILKHADKKDTKPNLTAKDAFIYLLGEKYPVELSAGMGNCLQIQENKAIFTLRNEPSHTDMLSLLHDYYRQEAPKHILPRVEYWTAQTALKPSKVSFRRAKTRWGSCSPANNISLNIHLMMLPKQLIDYVIVHELIHIRHKNHSKRFWNCVTRYFPEWKKAQKEIRKYEKFLT